MTCAYSHDLLMCQTDALGATAVGGCLVLTVVLAYYYGHKRGAELIEDHSDA